MSVETCPARGRLTECADRDGKLVDPPYLQGGPRVASAALREPQGAPRARSASGASQADLASASFRSHAATWTWASQKRRSRWARSGAHLLEPVARSRKSLEPWRRSTRAVRPSPRMVRARHAHSRAIAATHTAARRAFRAMAPPPATVSRSCERHPLPNGTSAPPHDPCNHSRDGRRVSAALLRTYTLIATLSPSRELLA